MEQLGLATPLFRLALPALIALAVIRLVVKVLHAAFPDASALRVLERTLSWLIWGGFVLWISGLLPALLEEAAGIGWKMGGAHVTLRNLIEGGINVAIALLLALWLSSAIRARLLREVSGADLSLRLVLANALRALLVFVAVLVALSAVGIDLTALSVLGGAIGVGIGLGLQKLAANYVAGFMVLAERSMRIGDVVRVGGLEGRITDIRARFTLIRSPAGAEAIVPNETLMTSIVENLTLTDRRVNQSASVVVGNGSDAEQVRQLLCEAALECPRVLREPAPSALLTGFGTYGLEFSVGYWLGDPEYGVGGPRSEINLAILRRLRAQGIEIAQPRYAGLPALGSAPPG
jgi:small-conductance mechanosensitive channel